VEHLADLGPGQEFGEEAPILGSTRNATVTMLEDGLLMRLAAEDFDQLLHRPLVQRLGPDEAIDLLRRGAVLVDVRDKTAYARGSVKGAVYIPLLQIRAAATGLERQRAYLLFCEDGRKSATAAFLLAQRGFQTHVLTVKALAGRR
jgi:rhodanese-related sulfurtransferase